MRHFSIFFLVVLDHSVVSAFAPFRHLPHCGGRTACGFVSLPTFRVKHQLGSVATPRISHENDGSVNEETQLDPHPNRRSRTLFLDGVCNVRGVTLKRFLSEIAILNPELQELTTLLGGIDTACKTISNTVKRSQLPSPDTPLGYDKNDADNNVAAASQDKEAHSLYVTTNNIMKRALRFTGRLGMFASEEGDSLVHHVVGDEEGEAKELVFDESENYVAVFDTLNGSSNIDAGIPTGTIIGIYQHDETCPAQEECVGLGPECSEDQARCLANTLQPRKNMVAAAYCLYSSSTSFVLTLGAGVYMFVLDDQIGEFVLSRPNLTIPETSSIMSFNEASLEKWDKPMQVVVKGWRNGTGQSGKQFSSRYIGSMVADVHRTLLHGGVFGYPADSMYANGKLHLLYEVAPMAFLVEQAGGIATTGTQRVMSILPEVIHQRTPIIMGSKDDVQELIDAYSEWSK